MRRARGGSTSDPISSQAANRNPASSPSGTTMLAMRASLSVPPSYTKKTPSGQSWSWGVQSTASIRPCGRQSPVSSLTSRRQAACGDSPASTTPPGTSQEPS
jgi:hypothetical protein